MAGEVKGIALITYQYSVVVKGLENKLKSLGYHVDVISGDYDCIKIIAPKISLFLLYLPNDLMDDKAKIKSLSKICGMVKDAGINMIALGEQKYHGDVEVACPEIGVFEWMNRPIDMEKIGNIVEDAMTRSPKAVSAGGKRRILIIDDDPTYAKMVREWIKGSYKVDVTTSGMQAIGFLLKVQEKEPVDLILLDYEMPVVDGPQVLQMLRQEPATEHIPVIFLTGLGTKEAVARVMELKPDGYLLKSTTRENLIGFLQNKLG